MSTFGSSASIMPAPSPQKAEPPASRRRSGIRGWGDEAAGIVVSTSLAALGIVLADRFFRPDWDFSWADHWQGAPVLYLAPGALAGFLWASLRLFPERVSRRFGLTPHNRARVRAGVVATLAGVGATPAALKTFSGARVSSTWLGMAGPPIFIAAVCIAVYVITLQLWRGQRRVMWGKRGLSMMMGGAFVLLGCAALWVDMNLYVGLYDHLHAFLEFCAFGFFVAACQLLGFVFIRAVPQVVWFNRGLSVLVVGLGLLFVSYKPLRTWTDSQLAHAWVDEYYVGRALRRAQLVELELTSNRSLRMARVDHLARSFGITQRDLHPAYLETIELDSDAILPAVKNIVFFYVDTLRADVADDASLMPHLAGFRQGALDFRRAYATGSDTLRSLPTITRGNYFLAKTHHGDLLRLARESGHHTRLIVPESAADFLAKLLPTFSFDEVDAVPDHDEGEQVWGYGAHRPTARALGERADEFLDSPAALDPFVLWLFHFDAHAWREIDEEHIVAERRRLGVLEHGDFNLRYSVVARSIDEQFGRFLRKLKERNLQESTAVIFLSDHGEGLGQGGFWVHSIFLWESLIRVPLAIRIPGIAPAVETAPVSLVDIAPTVAPIFGATSGLYHGQSLLGLRRGEPRRFPLLLRGGKYQGHDRIGVVDPDVHRKLVVRLEAAFVELYDYRTDHYDEFNLDRDEPAQVKQLLRQLALSPVFPRGEGDFQLHAHPGEIASLSSAGPLPEATQLPEVAPKEPEATPEQAMR